jgi:hypothetical protein
MLLSNPIYVRQIAHGEKRYPGLHPAIIDQEVWSAVQDQLVRNQQGHRTRSSAAQPSLLAGRLFDAAGERLTPSHAVRGAPDRGSSHNPSRRCSAKRRRHLPTVSWQKEPL